MQSKDTAHHHTARRFCSSSSTELALTQRTTQVQQASRCTMNFQQSPYSTGDDAVRRARVTDGVDIRKARSGKNDRRPRVTTTEPQSTNTAQHKDIIPTPNQLLPQWLVASAHTTTTSPLHYGYSDLFSDMFVARLPSLTCLSCSFKMIVLF